MIGGLHFQVDFLGLFVKIPSIKASFDLHPEVDFESAVTAHIDERGETAIQTCIRVVGGTSGVSLGRFCDVNLLPQNPASDTFAALEQGGR